jgi:hypothetical protein
MASSALLFSKKECLTSLKDAAMAQILIYGNALLLIVDLNPLLPNLMVKNWLIYILTTAAVNKSNKKSRKNNMNLRFTRNSGIKKYRKG